MTNYSVYNRFTLLNQKNHIHYCYYACLVLLICSIGMCFVTFPSEFELVGIYNCDKKKCYIETKIPILISKYLQEDHKIFIDDRHISIISLKFKQNELLENIVYQNVTIQIPKQNYNQNQSLMLKVRTENKNIWELFWDTWKGGEER